MPSLVPVIRRHPVVSSVCALAVVVFLVFGVRAGVEMAHWRDIAVEDPPIEGWMTPRYVVKTWDIPPDVMLGALGEGPMPSKGQTIDEIARDKGLTAEELATRIKAAAITWRAGQQ